MHASLPRLSHHVLFWLKEPESSADLTALLAAVDGLAVIPSVRGIHVGVPAATAEDAVVDASFSVSVVLFFDDVKGEAAYQSHPLHQQFIADNAHLWQRVQVYDAARL